jgi:hypothetical protein
MLSWIFSSGRISDKLDPRRIVSLHGIKFTLRKLRPEDYLSGANALVRAQDVYKTSANAGTNIDLAMINKLRAHYRDVLMAGVVSVKCMGKELIPTRKEFEPGEPKIHIDNLLTDWTLAEELYAEIMLFTYGKKKLKEFLSPKKN